MLALNLTKKKTITLDAGNTQNDLISRLIRNDKLAQEELYTNYFSQFVKIPMRYLKSQNDTYTVLNDAFIKIFDNVNKYSGKGTFEGWMSRIIYHTTIDHIRKRVKYVNIDTCDTAETLYIVNSAVENLSFQEILIHIRNLDERERVIFSMYAIDGYKHKEIANELGISEGTSKWYLNQARTKLQQSLKSQRS